MTLYVYRCPECPTTVALGVSLADPPRCRSCPSDGGPSRGRIMYSVRDTEAVLLPLEPAPQAQLVPLKVEHLHRAGILLPETQDALEWLYRHRATNGYAGAFTKVGGRRCIDLVEFARIARARK